jgi:hypothetical protein
MFASTAVSGVRTRNGNLSTVRSSVSSWIGVRMHVMRNAKPPQQSSGSLGASFPVKRAAIEFWSVLWPIRWYIQCAKRLLQVETTLNQPEAFKVYRSQSQAQAPTQSKSRHWQRLRRSIADLPRRAEVSRAANYRYLQAIASTQGNLSIFRCLKLSVERLFRCAGKAIATVGSIHSSPRMLLCFRPSVEENEPLRAFVTVTFAAAFILLRAEMAISGVAKTAAIGRRLRLLRAHAIICKTPRTHRYTLTPYGRNLLTAIIAAQQADTQKLTTLAA